MPGETYQTLKDKFSAQSGAAVGAAMAAQSANVGGASSDQNFMGGAAATPNISTTIQQQGTAENVQNLIDQREKEKLFKLAQEQGIAAAQEKQDSLLGKIKTKIMGGGEGGNLSLTPDFKDTLPAGMHPLRKQYEYLKEKYGDNWANTTQAKVLESYLSGVPVERGGGLGARDDTYGGGELSKVDQFGNFITDEQLAAAQKYRQQLLNNMGLAGVDIGGMNTMGTVAEQLEGMDMNLARLGLSPAQYFNFTQQLMAADPSAGNEAYKAARPFSSGSGLEALSRFIPGLGTAQTLGGILPERDLSGFENYADYEQAGAAFRPLPVPDQNNQTGPIRPPGFMPIIPLPDSSQPERPRYPLPGDPKRPPFMPPFMPDGGNFPLPVGINAFNPMFLGPSFQGSPYINQGVSPAFYEALRRFS